MRFCAGWLAAAVAFVVVVEKSMGTTHSTLSLWLAASSRIFVEHQKLVYYSVRYQYLSSRKAEKKHRVVFWCLCACQIKVFVRYGRVCRFDLKIQLPHTSNIRLPYISISFCGVEDYQ